MPVDHGDAVVFVTDFGWEDTYGGALVGACWRVEPDVRCVTATHGVPAGDVLAGAYHVKATALAFPRGAVVCAVVDPGVGGGRRALAVEAGGIRCVGPDNGLVSYIWSEAHEGTRRCIALPTPADASATFHGRDVFAPVAARIAAGVPLVDCGETVDTPLLLDEAFVRDDGDVLDARVVVVDHFGNAITTLRTSDLHGRRIVEASWNGGSTRRVVRTYAEIDAGLALVAGSAGHIEIAAARARAVDSRGPARGDAVRFSVAP